MKDNVTAIPSLNPTTTPSPSTIPTTLPSTSILPSLLPSTAPTPTPKSPPSLFTNKEGMTLQAIGFTLGGGLCVSLLAILAFGIAVAKRSTKIAPRCTARHPNTIYRWRGDIYKKDRGKRKKWGQSRGGRWNNDNNSNDRNNNENNHDDNEKNNNKSNKNKVKGKPSSTNPLKKSTALATRLVTGLDVTSLTAENNPYKTYDAEHERQAEFQKNAIGQDVYVGQGARTKVVQRHSNTGGTVGTIGTATTTKNELCDFNNNTGLYDIDSAQPIITTSPSLTNPTTAALNTDNRGMHPQDRGNPFLGWIPWTLHLSYDRMLRGIPGTGTREGGMGGKLLGVNLDAVVLFRFHGENVNYFVLVCLFVYLF